MIGCAYWGPITFTDECAWARRVEAWVSGIMAGGGTIL